MCVCVCVDLPGGFLVHRGQRPHSLEGLGCESTAWCLAWFRHLRICRYIRVYRDYIYRDNGKEHGNYCRLSTAESFFSLWRPGLEIMAMFLWLLPPGIERSGRGFRDKGGSGIDSLLQTPLWALKRCMCICNRGTNRITAKDVGANSKYRIRDWEDANPGSLLGSQGLKPVFS